MYLEIGETTKENARKRDVIDAIPSHAPSEDWHILVAHSDDDSIEAEGRADGRFSITYFAGPDIFTATQPVDGRELREAMADYADRDERWRKGRQWQRFEPTAKLPARTAMRIENALPFIAIGVIVIFIFFGSTLWELLDVEGWVNAIPLPAALDSTIGRLIVAFFAVCVLIFAIAVAVKAVEVRRASRWPSTFGTIVQSQAGFELKSPPGGGMPTNRRIAKVAYDFTVAGKTYRGTRVTLAEIIAEDEVGAILKRYPQGSSVKVYYDPGNPSTCVLERGAPAGIGLGCLALLAIGGAGLALILWFANSGADTLQRALPNAFLPVMLMTGIGAAGFLAAFIAARRSLAATRTWATTPGTVVSSTTASFTREASDGRTGQSYMPVVEYAYKVGGQSYSSRSVRFATEVGGSRSYAEKIAAAYPVGKVVTVHYDPADPTQAALEFKGGWTWVLLILGLGLAVAAVMSSGVLA